MGRSHRVEDTSSGRVLSATFVEKHTNKKDLIRRLREIGEALKDPDVEPNSPDYPGLGGLSAVLVDDRFLEHRDKEVRLHAVTACMQILEVYAPEAPYDDAELLGIFSQLIRQLANLAHCTSPSQANYHHYHFLLELLSDVKIGIILVELTKTLDNDSTPSRDEALEMLADLLRTILQCVHVDHPSDVADHAVLAVSACLDEFEGILPIPVMDEILMSISAGPVVMVTNPAAVEAAARTAAAKKKGHKEEEVEKMPPMQIQQTNPSYMVAAAIIRKSVDRISTPIANFLNGVLNGDPSTLAQTNISSDEERDGHFAPEKQSNANVWTIIYELHKISPQILTTVIGTVTNSLQAPSLERRLRVTKLLGKLFTAPTSNIGVQFSPCYREWIRRSTDIDSKVRLTMVKFLVSILSNKGNEEALARDASDALVKMMEHDPSLDVRLLAIHQVCDLAYKERDKKGSAIVPARLLRAVGNRVSAKNKTERRDAITGLVQIYYKYYVETKLKQVQNGGDDCEIDVILDALRDASESQGGSGKKRRLVDDTDVDEKYKWIPRTLFMSASFTDAVDPEMRSRVVQIVDDILLGGKKDALTPTSRAVGLAFITASLRDDDEEPHGVIMSNAYKWMCALFVERANLQRALRDYLDARAKMKAATQGTEEALAAEAEATERLETVATMTAPISGTSSSPPNVLEKLHTARDKHIFRILATIAIPDHSASARSRALDELPKRTKSLGDSTVAWVKTLARRCAMGHFINVDVIHDCIILAQECFHGGHIPECSEFLRCVKTAVEIYPALGGTKEGFKTLMELFGECRAGVSSNTRKQVEEYDIVTMLSSILAAAAPARMSRSGKEGDKAMSVIDSDLETDLLKLCTRDGTPEQARHAVYTMAALMKPPNRASPGSDGNEVLTCEEQYEAFGSLLKSLTSPSRMNLVSGSKENGKIVCILVALAALAESAPALFHNDGSRRGKGGEKAVRFALETCLMGRGTSMDDEADFDASDDDEGMSDDDRLEAKTPDSVKSSGRRRKSGSASKRKHVTPDGLKSAVEDERLSLACRRVCAAIEFVVSYIRHCGKSDTDSKRAATAPSERVEQIFDILCQIIEDGGLPPASRDRRDCKARQDRAALRKCAATHLLRLCDTQLNLEVKYLTHRRWHILASSLLDEEKSVRDGIMEELSMVLTGKGIYNPDGTPFAPSLRLVALVTLCVDLDHGAGHSGANGNAANVGKRSLTIKSAATYCAARLRKTSDATLAQSRARGAAAERRFETHFKMRLMPEHSVPYALHLLSFRRETPCAGGSIGMGLTQPAGTQPSQDNDEPRTTVDDETQHKVLRKRLKWLFEPLVNSLGEGADNISFLLRMVDFLANHYQPKDVSTHEASSPMSANSVLSPVEGGVGHGKDDALRAEALSAAKLKTICLASREVLLSFVKKDVNLTPYPGAIQLPGTLFGRVESSERISLSQSSGLSSLDSSVSSFRNDSRNRKSAPGSSAKSSGRKRSFLSQSIQNILPSENAAANRDSLDSIASRTGRSHTRNSSSPRRVHFSPELEQPARTAPLTQDNADGSDDSEDIGFDLSPVVKSHSPSHSDESETRTLGTTPPSILRTAPEDSWTDGERLSLDSSKSGSSAGSRRPIRNSPRLSLEKDDAPATLENENGHLSLGPCKSGSGAGSRRPTRNSARSSLEKEAASFTQENKDGERLSLNSSAPGSSAGSWRSSRRSARSSVEEEAPATQESMTTSETPDVSLSPSHDDEQKKRTLKESTRAKTKVKKDSAPPATTISLNRQVDVGVLKKKQKIIKTQNSRRPAKAATRESDDEFAFSDDAKVENSKVSSKALKKKASPVKKRSAVKKTVTKGKSSSVAKGKTSISMGKKSTKRTRR